jgi:hypothetical protein
MIVRVLAEGQYTVDDAHSDLLNGLDSGLERAVESGDEASFRSALTELLAQVRAIGEKLPDDSLEASDAVLPGGDSTIDEVREMLADTTEGLIPG